MLCKKCIWELSGNLTDEARDVFTSLIENGKMSKADIKRKSGLTRALVNKGISQLESILLVTHKIEGRANIYWLTENGLKLINLLEERGDKDE